MKYHHYDTVSELALDNGYEPIYFIFKNCFVAYDNVIKKYVVVYITRDMQIDISKPQEEYDTRLDLQNRMKQLILMEDNDD